MISGSSLNMIGVGSKSRSLGQILDNSCFYSRGHIFGLIFLKLAQNVVLMISRSSSIMGLVWSKSRSLGQILEKSCLNSRGHIFGLIFLKLAQDVCLDNVSVKFDHGWGGVKK